MPSELQWVGSCGLAAASLPACAVAGRAPSSSRGRGLMLATWLEVGRMLSSSSMRMHAGLLASDSTRRSLNRPAGRQVVITAALQGFGSYVYRLWSSTCCYMTAGTVSGATPIQVQHQNTVNHLQVNHYFSRNKTIFETTMFNMCYEL